MSFVDFFVHKAFAFQDTELISLNFRRPGSKAFVLLSLNVQQKQKQKLKFTLVLKNPQSFSLNTETIHYPHPF